MYLVTDHRKTDSIETDVLVVGGGAAGVAAAVTSARSGADVTLVERYGFCGGGAVAGLSGTVCGLYEASTNVGAGAKQVVFGFADQFVRYLAARGGVSEPMRYGQTYTRVHDPLVWREVADGLVGEAGVRVVYHALAVAALVEGGEALDGVLVSTKQGPLEIRAKVVVDASGDADIVAMADLPYVVGHGGRVQNPTMVFRLLGVDIETFCEAYGLDTIMPPAVGELMAAARTTGRYDLPRTKIWLFPTTRPDELLCNCTRVMGPDKRELNVLNWRDFTDAEVEGRLQVREYARFFRDYLAGCENSFVNDTGVQVGVRQTRQVDGIAKLTNEDVLTGAKAADGIARSPWPIELHSGERPEVKWLLEDTYEIPYGCFVPKRGERLFAVGRCLSAEHEAMASARVTAQCFSYGHAIGHAAAIAVRDRVAPRAIDGERLRILLNRDGARLN